MSIDGSPGITTNADILFDGDFQYLLIPRTGVIDAHGEIKYRYRVRYCQCNAYY